MDPVQKQASVQESSDPLLANTFELIWIRSGMFTGQSTHSKKSGLATGTLLEQLIRQSMLTRTAGSTHSKMRGCITGTPVDWLRGKSMLTSTAGSTHSKKSGCATSAPVMWLTRKHMLTSRQALLTQRREAEQQELR